MGLFDILHEKVGGLLGGNADDSPGSLPPPWVLYNQSGLPKQATQRFLRLGGDQVGRYELVWQQARVVVRVPRRSPRFTTTPPEYFLERHINWETSPKRGRRLKEGVPAAACCGGNSL